MLFSNTKLECKFTFLPAWHVNNIGFRVHDTLTLLRLSDDHSFQFSTCKAIASFELIGFLSAK